MKASELIKLLEKNGWNQVRQQGSHRIFKNRNNQMTIVVPDHGKKDIKPGTLHAILKQAGLK